MLCAATLAVCCRTYLPALRKSVFLRGEWWARQGLNL
jgi:hypothetical protein